MDAPAPAPAHRGPGTTDTNTDTNTNTTTDGLPPTSTRQRPLALAASAPQGPLEYLQLGNGRPLCFSRQSVPDPPAISFAKDLPQLVRTWDDSSPAWCPSEAVLRIQGELIALKHWPAVYRYGKSGQWVGTKKNWANCTSPRAGMSSRRTDSGRSSPPTMSYTAICEALKEEQHGRRSAAVAKQAKDKYGDRFGAAFEYWRGGDHIVRNKSSAIARHYRSLHVSD
ncbi:hypothetical protein EDB84DRAFT_1439144 [Lactarius hengduanensis]|nr:hypothetical protein EDB84DRAFT_1439144 [Lactarius hengduanensis]